MENKIKQLLVSKAVELFGTTIEEKSIQFQVTRKEFEGDFTLVVFPFAKLWKMSPQDAANRMGEIVLNAFEEIESYNVIQGFLNLCLSGIIPFTTSIGEHP